jgi:phosphomevalonate kinase
MSVICTTPGKILAVGGYLVLKRPNPGLVIGTSARFTCTLSALQASERSSAVDGTVRVDSPQFDNTNWYQVRISDTDGTLQLTPGVATQRSNALIESAVAFALLLATADYGAERVTALLQRGLHLTVCGDNDFYSQEEQVCGVARIAVLSALSS